MKLIHELIDALRPLHPYDTPLDVAMLLFLLSIPVVLLIAVILYAT